jgi:hypothetical protein
MQETHGCTAVAFVSHIHFEEHVMSMNKGQVKGRAKEVKGMVKEVAGKLVGNKKLEEKGQG